MKNRNMKDKKIVISILVPIIFIGAIFFAHSQTTLETHPFKDAEKLYAKFFPLSISLKYQKLDWENTVNTSIEYEELDVWTPAAGIEYSFYQTGQFNFNAGFFVRNMSRKTYRRLYAEDIPFNYDYATITKDSPYWTYHLPINIEYINYLSKGFALSLHLGYEFQYYGITEGEETFEQLSFTVDGVRTPVLITTEEESNKSLTAGVNMGFGFYAEIGSTLMRLDFNYHYHFRSLINSSNLATNLQVSPDAISFHQWNGHHIGFNLSFFPWRRNAHKLKNITKK